MTSPEMQLFRAAEVGDCAKLQSLLLQNVNLNYNYRNFRYENAISIAAAFKHFDFMRLLLDNGANVYIVDSFGYDFFSALSRHSSVFRVVGQDYITQQSIMIQKNSFQ